jgi:hypothetical protein
MYAKYSHHHVIGKPLPSVLKLPLSDCIVPRSLSDPSMFDAISQQLLPCQHLTNFGSSREQALVVSAANWARICLFLRFVSGAMGFLDLKTTTQICMPMQPQSQLRE